MKKPQRDLADALKRNTEEHQDPQPQSDEPKKKTQRPASRVGRTQVGVYVLDDAHLQLKVLALEKRTSIQDLGIEAINLLFKLNNKPPIAK